MKNSYKYLLVAALSGCVTPAEYVDQTQFAQAITSLELRIGKPRKTADPSMVFPITFENPENLNVCTSDILNQATSVTIYDQSKKFQLGRDPLFVDYSPSFERKRRNQTRRIEFEESVTFDLILEPILGAYFYTDKALINVTREYHPSHKLTVKAAVIVFPCHFRNIFMAIEAGLYLEVQSNYSDVFTPPLGMITPDEN